MDLDHEMGPMWGNETLQMNCKFEGFPLSTGAGFQPSTVVHCLGW